MKQLLNKIKTYFKIRAKSLKIVNEIIKEISSVDPKKWYSPIIQPGTPEYNKPRYYGYYKVDKNGQALKDENGCLVNDPDHPIYDLYHKCHPDLPYRMNDLPTCAYPENDDRVKYIRRQDFDKIMYMFRKVAYKD